MDPAHSRNLPSSPGGPDSASSASGDFFSFLLFFPSRLSHYATFSVAPNPTSRRSAFPNHRGASQEPSRVFHSCPRHHRPKLHTPRHSRPKTLPLRTSRPPRHPRLLSRRLEPRLR